MFNVYVKGDLKKSYHYKIQACIWCVMKGYVGCYRGKYWLFDDVEIKEE